MAMTPTHKALRDATAAAHERVDAAFGGFDLNDRADYARFLMAHAEIVWAIEATLPGERVTPDWDERKRGHLLREDLAFLPRIAEAPMPPLALDWESAEAIAGTLYVLEGSRLGGKFLARRLSPGFPMAYLNADQRAGSWQQLLERIDTLLRDPAAFESALAAADATFAAFERSAAKWQRVAIGDGR